MSVREYIGARYVPLFADPLQWDNTQTYEPLTIVSNLGNSYTSRQYVPAGIDITNTDYWALTGNYNAQIEAYRQETQRLATTIGNDFSETPGNTVSDFAQEVQTDISTISNSLDGFAGKNNAYDSNSYGETLDPDYELYTYPNLIDWGSLEEAPYAKPFNQSDIDIIAHWYNDFGLQSTALAPNQENGNYLWYDWRWNFPINATQPISPGYTYDEAREPLFGFYPGDNRRVLDWICYWLIESGVNVVYLTNEFKDITDWALTSSVDHWKYVLFNQVKNFKSLRYIVDVFGDTHDSDECDAAASKAISVMSNYGNLYSYRVNDKNYAVLGIWDSNELRGAYDNYNGHTNTVAKLNSVADSIIALGYDGVIYLTRALNTTQFADYIGLDKQDSKFIMLECQYSGIYQDQTTDFNNSYAQYANTVAFPTTKYTIPNICTARKTQAPHPSTFDLQGSTPADFATLVTRVVNHIYRNNLPHMFTVYNVSEWAEGGAGLIPNKKYGFGYLDALRSGVVRSGQAFNFDNLTNDIQSLAIQNRKHFYMATATGTLNGQSVATIEVPLNNLYDYHDHIEDYIVITDVRCTTELTKRFVHNTSVNFGTKHCYFSVKNTDYVAEEDPHSVICTLILIYNPTS